ncbi:MAG: transglycosylase SLT domain-containing protein [Bacilli bacterium]|nr:transglycosylase SLT domain-containing protein [Bacilli bacterium]
MEKFAYIGASEHGLYLETKVMEKSGEKYRKRTNKEDTIQRFINQNATRFIDAIVTGDNLTLYTADKVTIIVRKYAQLQDEPLLRVLFRRLNRAPIVSENLKQNKKSNVFQLLQLKILYANKKRLAALALSGTLLVTTGAIFLEQKSLNQQEPVAEISSFLVGQESYFKEKDKVEEQIVKDVENLSEITSLDVFKRLEETEELQKNYNSYDNSKIMLGARVNRERIEAIFDSERGKTIIETAIAYGIDPYILLAKGLTESNLEHEACLPNGSRYNGYGVGAFQLESPDGRIVKAWNYETQSEESLSITMENAIDFKNNTKAAAMYFQNRINLYNGNIYLALQSYNYGQGMMRIIIHDYAKQMGITEEEVKNNFNDLGWLKIVQDVHLNPNNYYYRVMLDLDETDLEIIQEAQKKYVWKHSTYGNPHYIADVLSYYVGLESQNQNLSGTTSVINFSNNEVKEISRNDTILKVF